MGLATGSALRKARRRAGLTQRELAVRTGIAQPTIARIESGAAVPRVDTFNVLLRACGDDLEVVRRVPGTDVDRSLIRDLLRQSPRERLRLLARDAAGLARLERAARR